MAMVFAADGLDGGETLLLLAYTNYTDPHGYCWPSEQRLADVCGTSLSTVARQKRSLKAKKLLKSVRRISPKTGEPISNLSRINLPLLASMRRADRSYDDDLVQEITFDDGSAADHGKASDLLKCHSDGYPLSNRQVPSSNLTGTPRQSDRQSLTDPSGDTTNCPSVPAADPEQTDGWTDGAVVPHQIGRNPGVDLLLAIGAEQPEFLLTGKTLRDQGLVAAGMLLEGWTPEQLRQVIAGRPLPDQISTTVGAVVSSRLRQALSGPVPAAAKEAAGHASMSAEVATIPRKPVIPMQCCDRCDLGFRSSAPGLCRGCREDVTA